LEIKSTADTPLAVSIPQLARLTGVSEGTLYLRANEGSLPGCRRIGKRWVVHLETFNDFLKSGMGEEAATPLIGNQHQE
jgi:predicted DNA-binding transcriptional regulator AlpA